MLQIKWDTYIKLAEDYNRAEQSGNNYWCRFSLREPDLIDIEKYLK